MTPSVVISEKEVRFSEALNYVGPNVLCYYKSSLFLQGKGLCEFDHQTHKDRHPEYIYIYYIPVSHDQYRSISSSDFPKRAEDVHRYEFLEPFCWKFWKFY